LPAISPAAIIMWGASLRAPTGAEILRDIDWTVERADRWVVLGRNGSGKTSLLSLAGALNHPSRGTVDVLGERLGRTDIRTLRRRIGLQSATLELQLRPTLHAEDAVMTAKYGALEPWWHEYTDADRERARHLLADMGCGGMGERQICTLSEGERQRVLLARLLMPEPELLLVDEPAAGLDLPAREALVTRLGRLARDPTAPPLVLVTHHVEEIPPGITAAMLLKDGRVLASGAPDEVLTSESLSECYGLALNVERREERWFAWARVTLG
jgi:iron complex transport system ATP-binding protein